MTCLSVIIKYQQYQIRGKTPYREAEEYKEATDTGFKSHEFTILFFDF